MILRPLLAILVVVSAALSGCTKTPPIVSTPDLKVLTLEGLPVPDVASAAVTRPYVLGPRDKLSVVVVGFSELTGKIQADGSGNISVPIAGTIAAAGKTPAEVEAIIVQRLRANYVRNPQVSVNLEDSLSQTVTVDGEVREPGVYPVVNNMSLVRAVAAARGPSEFAKLDDVVVFRTVGGQRYAGLYNLSAIRRGIYEDPMIYANDVVVVGDSASRRMFKNLLTLTPLLTTPIIIALQKL